MVGTPTPFHMPIDSAFGGQRSMQSAQRTQRSSSSSSAVPPGAATDLFGRHQRDDVDRAHVGAEAAQHALVDVEDDVGEAPQAAGRLAAGLLGR